MRSRSSRAGPTLPAQVVWLDFGSRSVEVLRESVDMPIDASFVSVPRQIEFPTDGGVTSFAHFYAPANPNVVAPEGERSAADRDEPRRTDG